MTDEITFPLDMDVIKERNAEIAEHVQKAYASLKAAQDIADKYRLHFRFRPTYGMGGSYCGDPEERSSDNEDGWYASSQGC